MLLATLYTAMRSESVLYIAFYSCNQDVLLAAVHTAMRSESVLYIAFYSCSQDVLLAAVHTKQNIEELQWLVRAVAGRRSQNNLSHDPAQNSLFLLF